MQLVESINLPVLKTNAKVKQERKYIIVMECIFGVRLTDIDKLFAQNSYSLEGKTKTINQANVMAEELKVKFSDAGIFRKFDLKDMIFDIDWDNKQITKIISIDWEKAKLIIKVLYV